MNDWRHRIHVIINEADTPAGKAFDVLLLLAIMFSVVVVCLESVPAIGDGPWAPALNAGEWILTALFTVEYLLRLICVRRRWAYALSFFGLVDLLAILPAYIAWLLPGAGAMLVIRALRLLRVFRILKLARFQREASVLAAALHASRHKIMVFLFAVLTVVVIVATAMYVIESGSDSGFTSIPQAMYWAIVTMTTVGYGDIAPATILGKFLAAVLMVLGYGIIAVPTGIVSVELHRAADDASTRACPACARDGHDPDAEFCKYCGGRL